MLRGPYFPPDDYFTGQPLPSPWPEQPGILLLLVSLIVVIVLVVRELTERYRHRPVTRVDDLSVIWLPVEAASMIAGAVEDEISFGGWPRRLPARQRTAQNEG